MYSSCLLVSFISKNNFFENPDFFEIFPEKSGFKVCIKKSNKNVMRGTKILHAGTRV